MERILNPLMASLFREGQSECLEINYVSNSGFWKPSQLEEILNWGHFGQFTENQTAPGTNFSN